MTAPILEGRGIVRRFGHVQGLRDADFSIHEGEIVAVIGDNGAEKSTLVKILSGADQPNEGQILIDGEPVTFPNPHDARARGIETVYQDRHSPRTLTVQPTSLPRSRNRPTRLPGTAWLPRQHTMAGRVSDEVDRLGVHLCWPLTGGAELTPSEPGSAPPPGRAAHQARTPAPSKPKASQGRSADMPLVTTASIVDPAQHNGHGVAAFNVITLEHAEAIAAGAERAGQPAILQISENAVRFHHDRLRPLAAAVVAVASESSAPLAVHLDHVENTALLHQAAGTGISSVMFDASRLDYQANVAATREAAQWAHERGIWLEAELGEIGGKDGAHAPGVRTDPDDALEFVAATLVDGLAVAVGSSHAMVDRTAALDIPLIHDLARKLAVPLVLHGSSGVPDDTLAAAVRAGMVKINVGTILNVAFTGAVREHLARDESVVDPRKYLAQARDAVTDEVARILTVIGRARS